MCWKHCGLGLVCSLKKNPEDRGGKKTLVSHPIWVCLKIVYPYTQWLMIIIPIKWLLLWEYTPFSDTPIWVTTGIRANVMWSWPPALHRPHLRPAQWPHGVRHAAVAALGQFQVTWGEGEEVFLAATGWQGLLSQFLAHHTGLVEFVITNCWEYWYVLIRYEYVISKKYFFEVMWRNPKKKRDMSRVRLLFIGPFFGRSLILSMKYGPGFSAMDLRDVLCRKAFGYSILPQNVQLVFP